MDTLEYILNKFGMAQDIPDEELEMPIEILNFTRNDLAKLFAELEFELGAEIGVEQGEYSETLLRENPKLRLYGIDAWEAYEGYRDHTRQEKLDRFAEATRVRMQGYEFKPIRKFSMDAVKEFVDNSLDFVYIDANHDFAHVTEDIFHWSKKVRPGGIVSGHDYYKENVPSHVHVPYVLEGYTKAYNILPWFIFEDSWMFVKQ